MFAIPEAMVKKFFYLFLLTVCFFIPSLATAQGERKNIFDLSLEELMALEAQVASNIEKDYKKQPVSVTTITRMQLEHCGARTLADALSIFVPGFFLVEDQDDVIAGFRGLAPDNNSKVLLLLNGQNMNIEWFWGPPASLLNTSQFDFIERIEVIRGPGSVTLGQSALLGVINIITKTAKGFLEEDNNYRTEVNATGGKNLFLGGNASVAFTSEVSSGYFYIGMNHYNGQTLRNEGWARDKKNEGYRGGAIVDIGTRLKRSSNSCLVGNFNVRNFGLGLFIAEHEQDLYNFYRDRNQFGEQIVMVAPSFQHSFSPSVSVGLSLNGIINNFSLMSVDVHTMGGAREDKWGGRVLINLNDLIPNNRLAVGSEYRGFSFGKPNFQGNNFINNKLPDGSYDEHLYIENVNREKVWGYSTRLDVLSFFAENYYSLGTEFDIFAGIRYDRHPYWGANLSPRLGLIYSPRNLLRIRLSYQTGFRGAVGIHYGGGYRQDGLLSAKNFDQVNGAEIPVLAESGFYVDNAGITHSTYGIAGFESNISVTKPEKMRSLELALDYSFDDKLSLVLSGFYNRIINVIDVGVIWRPSYFFESQHHYDVGDTTFFTMPNIGTDLPGDWNGYWFFKNTQGDIHQGGGEMVLTLKTRSVFATLSHSLVKVISFDNQQRGSMYLTTKGSIKAYPENITRVNIISSLTNKISIGMNYLYYFRWNSPTDQEVKSNHLVNLSINFSLLRNLKLAFNCVNLFNQRLLYPMNSNVGDASLSDGTPSVEATTFWVNLSYQF